MVGGWCGSGELESGLGSSIESELVELEGGVVSYSRWVVTVSVLGKRLNHRVVMLEERGGCIKRENGESRTADTVYLY